MMLVVVATLTVVAVRHGVLERSALQLHRLADGELPHRGDVPAPEQASQRQMVSLRI